VWREDEGADWLVTCALVTTRANSLMEPVHDRMPVLLPEESWDEWLDREHVDLDALTALLVPAPDDELELWPVRTLVGDARNNGPELVEPLPPDELPEDGVQGALF
jgi:putative SOS response-associated peptidase YedK